MKPISKLIKNNMRLVNALTILISFFLLFSCTEKEHDIKLIPQIKSFKFEISDNNKLSEDVTATIDNNKKNINVIFPVLTSLTSLIPTIIVSEGVNVSPNSKVQQDLSKPILYTLSGDGYETIEYILQASVKRSENAEILKFNFLANNNPQLSVDLVTKIESKTIKAQVSDTIDISALKPSIEISEGASISPANIKPLDFTEDVKYTVTAQDTSIKSEYVVQINSLSSKKKITSFQVNINDILYEADINNNNFEISLFLPYNTDLSSLTPIIEVEELANITPSSNITKDFNEVVTYKVIAEDGSIQEYVVNVTTLSALENDRAVLEELYEVNKDYNIAFTYLDWDLDANTMEDWAGVTISDGRVTGLIISTIYIHKIPQRIGELSELKSITIVGTQLKELPIEVGDLDKLEKLSLYDNELTQIPKEIGQLKSIVSLHLQDNELNELPAEIGQMSKLLRIEVQNNNLNELPVELANIPNLLMLNIKNNPLTGIPQVICEMKTESSDISIIISKDEEDVCD